MRCLQLVYLALLTLGQILILLLEVLNDLCVVDLLRATLVYLLLRHLLYLKHDLVETVLVDQCIPESLSLVKQEVYIYVAKNLLFKPLNQLLFNLNWQLFFG